MKMLKFGRRGGHTSGPAAATETATQPRSNGRTTPRAEAARACKAWTELDEADLVPRGGGRFLVHADSDEVFSPFGAGLIWHRDSDRIEYGHDLPLHFTVSEDGSVRLFEKYRRSWSEIIASQAGAR
jgi:hypothetical protein